MPFYCIFERRPGGEFLRGTRWHGFGPHDSEKEVAIELPDTEEWPGKSGARWDGAEGVRPPTGEEIDQDLVRLQKKRVQAALDDLGVNDLLLRMIWDIEERLRTMAAPVSTLRPLAEATSAKDLAKRLSDLFGPKGG